MSNELCQNNQKLSADMTCFPAINLAFQQNSLPFVQSISVKNLSAEDLHDVTCNISSVPSVIVPKTITLNELKSGEEISLSNPGIKLDYGQLASISEELKVNLSIDFRCGEETLLTVTRELSAFSADQWLGFGILPELLAAFVTPNLEVVTLLQSVVADELKKATGSSSVEGYQADKKRVYETCAAIYRAIHSRGINYANPPSSFASPGQRIRFADTVCTYHLGTCLDTTLLFASVMEHCGLHPVILIHKGHAYIGCHLVDRYFPDVPMDDLQTIRKLVDLDEFVVIETTCVTDDITFSEAEARARKQHLNRDDDFECAIDVIRARYSKIKPIPVKRSTNGIELVPPEMTVSELGEEHKRELQEEVDLARLEKNMMPSGRVERWSQKLLDLSLRNRLLNVRDTKQIIPIACSDITVLEDKIASNSSISLNALENLLSEKDLHDIALLRTSEIKSEDKALLDKELSQGRLWTYLSQAETNKRITEVYRQSKSDLEEGGVNTLFLAIGFLEWRVTENEERSHLAPLLLVPIRVSRKSIAEGFRISRIDEDSIINETLLELLRSQFKMTIPGISPLPLDDSGVDVARVLQIFKQSIREMKGWEVREEAKIALFSFSKFTMWNDMTSRIDALKESPIVNHLICGGGLFDDGIEVFDPKDVGKHIDYSQLFCAMSADSSQLAAVLYSEQGKNFVLHGPPGTGKSQTITNIIAHNLALGKKVLFVSEKKAALDVVHKRLSSIGLKPFCLELHSNKSGKQAVLAQFAEALQVPEPDDVGEWSSTVRSIENLRTELNAYVSELHKPFPNGLTAYACFSRFLAHKHIPENVHLAFDCSEHERNDFDNCTRLVDDLNDALCATTKENINAFRFLKSFDWNPSVEKEICAFLSQMLDAAESLKASAPGSDTKTLCEFRNLKNRGNDLSEDLKNYNLDRFNEINCEAVGARISRNNESFFLMRFFKNRALIKELTGLKKLGAGALTIDELEKLLPDIETYRNTHTALAATENRIRTNACGANIDFDALPEKVLTFERALEASTKFSGDLQSVSNLEELCDLLARAKSHSSSLRGVLRCKRAADAATAAGLGEFATAMETFDAGEESPREIFLNLYHKEMLDKILSQSPALCNFTGTNHEQRIARFRELDDKYTTYAKQVIFARLAAMLPRRRQGMCPAGTELGLLKRECEKRARHKPIRQLLSQIPNLASTLKPCFLMSPLSVAQYLPADSAPFDLIVFDEASQIPVWDAIGVIARGKQLIVVGDPKQMPPTNFFQKGDAGDVDETSDEIEDMESILDECIAAGIHSSHLNWHYRSRHESLISFSNHYYYDDRLFTFPSACNSPRLGVRFEFVEKAVYDRRATRTNRAEAAALVKYVFDRLDNSELDKRSVGIVTFSQAQKDLIEDMIEQERIKHPNLEEYFSDQNEEPLFVKNLENVQGDERDVILFSICYAPDAEGKFTMNFGPLNRAGGERRLNVAITRAKEQVVVFSSIHAEQIDLNRTQATGAVHLKHFLEYAERGLKIQGKQTSSGTTEGLTNTVAALLTAHGYTYERNVGCSGYKIDLAVHNPKSPKDFMAAIECDGPSYAAQKTTRDRDKLRASVLKALGWQSYRVWTADWAFERTQAEKHLLEFLKQAEMPQPPPPSKPTVASGSKSLPPSQPIANASRSRTPATNSAAKLYRSIDEVPRAKIIAAMKEVQADFGSCERDTLYRETLKLLGLSVLTAKARRYLDDASRES